MSSRGYSIRQFSLNLPVGPNQADIPGLLRHLADHLERTEGKPIIQDIVFHNELDENGDDLPCFVVYFSYEQDAEG